MEAPSFLSIIRPVVRLLKGFTAMSDIFSKVSFQPPLTLFSPSPTILKPFYYPTASWKWGRIPY